MRQLDVDETSWLRANRRHTTLYATGLVDLDRHILIDMVLGNSANDLRRWVSGQDPGVAARHLDAGDPIWPSPTGPDSTMQRSPTRLASRL